MSSAPISSEVIRTGRIHALVSRWHAALWDADAGQTAIEYAVWLVLVGAATLLVFGLLGGHVQGALRTVVTTIWP